MERIPLTANQRRGFFAAWGGWVLDGMDSFIYALVMLPALRELLPRSGISGDQSHIGFYGGLLFALFLVGWGCSLVWGPIADRFGRVLTLMLTILCYSIFTFLGAFATGVWMLALFRLLAGVGIGGEWFIGCLLLPILAEQLGRRFTLAIYFALMAAFISLGFGYVFYLQSHALLWFMTCLFFLGVGGANFAMYTLWLPEQYRTECRASAFAFATSAGRFAGAGITFLVGAGVSYFGTIGIPVALTSLAFVIGLLLLPFGKETKGAPLPA